MKSLFFLLMATSLFFFSYGSVVAETGIFSGLYHEVSTTPQNVALGVLEKTGLSSAELWDIVYGSAALPEQICLSSAESHLESVARESCQMFFQHILQRERSFAQEYAEGFRFALAASRFWDGELSSTKDFDLMVDLDILDHQFFGSKADILDVPKPDRAVREGFSREDSALLGSLSLQSGCGDSSISQYGGIACVPSFCADIACVDVEIIPGRRAVITQGGRLESSLDVMVERLFQFGLQQKDRGGSQTPTRNTNRAHWFSQIFHWMMDLRGNIIIEGRTPPLLDEIVPRNARVQKRVIYEYALDTEGNPIFKETLIPPEAKTPSAQEEQVSQKWDEIFSQKKDETGSPLKVDDATKKELKELSETLKAELRIIRQRDFAFCTDRSECSAETVLEKITEDSCLTSLPRLHLADMGLANTVQCFRDNPPSPLSAFRLQENNDHRDLMKEFSLLADELQVLWKNVADFEKAWGALGGSVLKQSLSFCGTPKG